MDEEYPFEVLCIHAGEYDTIIVLDGGGYTVGAEQWLRSQAGGTCLKHVFNQGSSNATLHAEVSTRITLYIAPFIYERSLRQ